MNIAQLINSNTASSLASSQTSTQATTGTGTVSHALKRVDARIQSQLDTTGAQLSSFGKLKSAVSDAQLAAHALSAFTSTASTADIKAAASRFVAAYNTALTTAKATASLPGTATAQSSSVGRFSRDLSRTLSTNTATLDALKKMGIKPQADGTLTLDTAKFDAAQKADPANVRATLAKIGQWVDKAATTELATGSGVSDAMASLSQRSAALKAQQSAMSSLVQSMTTAQNLANSSYGLSAYNSRY